MKVHELIGLLEDMPEDADVRLAFQPSWPLQYDVADVVLDEGHVHEPVQEAGEWYCDDPDCGMEFGTEAPSNNGIPADEAPNTAYIVEAGQVDDAPYLPASVSKLLGWR